MQIVPEQVLYSIFSNAEVIIGCNQEFLRGLKEIFPAGADSITAEAQIGQVFTKMVLLSLLALSRLLSLSLSLSLSRLVLVSSLCGSLAHVNTLHALVLLGGLL